MTTPQDDGYIDILKERRNSSDFLFAYRKWQCTPCRYSLNRSPQNMKKEVLASHRVQTIIEELSQQDGQSKEKVEESANAILDEMAHNFQLKTIRFISFVLTKFLKQVYGSIFVNKKGIEKVVAVSNQYPILFLPTHRSYADFLLVSYLCYQFDLPIPVIAAGIGMKTVSTLLRNAGAFFIRRSFIDDQLYWQIFSEYVKSHIQGCEFPMEFFIEGTRSRSAKSLVPKIGMLQVIMEEFFCSKIPDITIVPISISYDRTLEETLYAYELLGVPKPKETTTGLLKARKILSTNFSNAYIHLGDPVSCKEFFNGYNRSVHNLCSRKASFITKEEQVLCQDLAIHIVHTHQNNLLLSPFTLVCLVIGHPCFISSGGIEFDHLVDLITWLGSLVKRTGASIYFGQMVPSVAVEFSLKAHSNIIQLSSDLFISTKFLSKNDERPSSAEIKRLQEDTLNQAVPSMFVSHYSNQVLQLLVHCCMVCMAMDSSNRDDYLHQDDVFYRYNTLRKLLQREFVFGRSNAEMDFFDALLSLKEEGLLYVRDGAIILVEEGYEKINFLKQLLLQFLDSYYVICMHLLSLDGSEDYNCQTLARHCQIAIEYAIINGNVMDYKCLSLDIANNCIAFLITQKALRKEKKNGHLVITPSHSEIMNIMLSIESFIPAQPKDQLSTFTTPFVAAKL